MIDLFGPDAAMAVAAIAGAVLAGAGVYASHQAGKAMREARRISINVLDVQERLTRQHDVLRSRQVRLSANLDRIDETTTLNKAHIEEVQGYIGDLAEASGALLTGFTNHAEILTSTAQSVAVLATRTTNHTGALRDLVANQHMLHLRQQADEGRPITRH